MTTRFDGRRVFMTGVASGIGAATYDLFRAEGAKVYGVDVNPGEGQAKCDVADPEAVEESVGAAAAEFGGLDVVVNVAGINTMSRVEDLPLERWNRILAVNLTGPMLVTRAALPHLRDTKGAVVTVASVSGMRAQPYLSAYGASKAGLLQLMRSLAIEFAADGVRVNCVCPGGVGAIDPESAKSFVPAGIDMSLLARLRGVLPGVTDQGDIAEAIAYLASDAARSVTGTHLVVDRGTTW